VVAVIGVIQVLVHEGLHVLHVILKMIEEDRPDVSTSGVENNG
jgi:hypothetical protein